MLTPLHQNRKNPPESNPGHGSRQSWHQSHSKPPTDRRTTQFDGSELIQFRYSKIHARSKQMSLLKTFVTFYVGCRGL
jgi:hypothetical protein